MCFVMESLYRLALSSGHFQTVLANGVEADVLGVVTLTDCPGNRELTPSAESRCWPPPDVVISNISTEVKS